MAKLIFGDRIAREGQSLVGSSAAIFDAGRNKLLLTRRADNGRWCLPGGRHDPGETVTETAEREVYEETGLRVRVVRLIGVYSDPHRLLTYADGNRYHLISLHFEAEVLDGELALSDETTEFGYFTREEIDALDLMEHHRERIGDGWTIQAAPIIR